MSIFKEKIQINAPGKSKFDLSHEKKISCDFGKLVPIFVQETLPGDSFNLNTDILVRVTPMLAPIMHRIDVYTHFFFVPNRIIWNEWETFLTGGSDGLQAPVHPTLQFTNTKIATGSLMDYMGLPSDDSVDIVSLEVNALPFRAYMEIFNEYYRDENLIPKQNFSKGSGLIATGSADFLALVELKKRAWEKDYFTTALPFAQKGNPAAAPVDYSPTPSLIVHGTGSNQPAGTLAGNQTLASNVNAQLTDDGTKASKLVMENEASVLITELRKAARLQEFLEAAARGGHRLTEWILHVFGVESSDARIQRPEYLGGGRTPLNISEVLSNFQFSGDAEGKPQGNMAGHGIAVGSEHGFNRSFEEHGWIIGIMSILPKANYYQGIEKHWQRPTRFDYYIPQFAHLGEQEVKNKEIYFDPAGGTNEDTFGYQSRYADYKFRLSTIHGQFRNSLSFWHLARKFSATPGLNQTFIECNPPKDIFAGITATDHPFLVQIYNDCSAVRPLPYFSNPKL